MGINSVDLYIFFSILETSRFKNYNQDPFLSSRFPPLQQHQLSLRRAARPRSHVPVREATLEDRHASLGHRIHCTVARGAAGRLRPVDVRGEMLARGNTRGTRPLEHQRPNGPTVVDQLGEPGRASGPQDTADQPGVGQRQPWMCGWRWVALNSPSLPQSLQHLHSHVCDIILLIFFFNNLYKNN
jgi:hypothetical protein